MFKFEESWAESILSGFAPGLADDATRAHFAVDYLGALRTFVARGTFLSAVGVRLALWMTCLSPFWLERRLITLPKLPPHERTQLLGRLLTHRAFAVREFMLLLKLVASMALLRSETVRAASHYDDWADNEALMARSGERPRTHLRLVRNNDDDKATGS